MDNAYQLAIAIFKQSASGTVYGKLPDEYGALKWDLTASIIPTGYDFTNFQQTDAQVETVEKNTITALTKARKYNSGAMTPPAWNFATVTPGDEATIMATLDALTSADADDQYKVLACAGVYTGTSSGVRTYNVFNAFCGILTTDGGRQAEAKAPFTGTLGLQACHFPIMGVTACNATLSWTESTGVIAFAAN